MRLNRKSARELPVSMRTFLGWPNMWKSGVYDGEVRG
jgi:hypothetical protein